MIKRGQPLLLTGKKIRELKRAGKVRPLGTPVKTWMGVPLKIEGKAIGALVVNDYKDEDAFDRQDLELMKLVSGQVALSIEHSRTDQSLRESEELFRTLAEHSPNMIYLNKLGPILYANKKCEQILGYKRKEFYHPDFNFLQLVAPEFRELMKTYFGEHKKGREVPPYRSALLSKRGKRIDVLCTTKLIQHQGESVLLGILTEIP
jgi:PAS domain S-box-containing protein